MTEFRNVQADLWNFRLRTLAFALVASALHEGSSLNDFENNGTILQVLIFAAAFFKAIAESERRPMR